MKVAIIFLLIIMGLGVFYGGFHLIKLGRDVEDLSMELERVDILIEEVELLKEGYEKRIESFDSLKEEVENLRKEVEDIRQNQSAILKLLQDYAKKKGFGSIIPESEGVEI